MNNQTISFLMEFMVTAYLVEENRGYLFSG